LFLYTVTTLIGVVGSIHTSVLQIV